MRRALWIALALLPLAAIGCSVYPMANSPHGARTTGMVYTDFVMPICLETSEPAKWEPIGRAKGTSGFHGILGLFAWGDASYAAAYAEALEASGADALIDTQCDINVYHVLGIYVSGRITVSGLAVKAID